MKLQFFSLFGSRVFAALLQAFMFVVLSRSVSVSEFGLVGAVASVAAFGLLICDFGVTSLLSRAVAVDDLPSARSCLRINDVVALALSSLLLLAMIWIPGDIRAVALLSLALTIERNSETELSVFYALGSKLIPSASILARRAVGLFSLVILIWTGVDGLWAFSAAMTMGACASQIIQRSALHARMPRGEVERPSATFSRSAPFWFSSVLNQVRLLDNGIVGLTAGPFAAGLYSAASRITNPLMLIPASISQVVLPHVSRNPSTSWPVAKKLVWVVCCSYGLVFLVAGLLPNILAILFGQEYREAAPILFWGLVGLPVVALAGPLAAILQGLGQERFVAFNGAAFAVVAVGAMVVGAFVAGAEGLAAAIAVCSVVRIPSLLYRIRRVTQGRA